VVNSILNISAYLFVNLDELQVRKDRYLRECLERELKGTILLSEEGINVFLAGEAVQVRGFMESIKKDPLIAPLTAKESWSEYQPFRKMIIKIKAEIIRMNHPTIQPQSGRAPSIAAQTLATWLRNGVDDQGREVVCLDTRNDFEVEMGKFVGAVDFNISHFSQFPNEVLAQQEALKDKTIVSYCTGGIRCEKAAIYMREIGLDNVYQLEGGILKYFEDVGNDHYQGSCFVFDERRALAPNLLPPGQEIDPS
jgi:UPF0176 protein